MIGGTRMGDMESLVGGGLGEPDLEVWGPLWWSQNHHKVGGVGEYLLRQSRYVPCSLLCGLVGPSSKLAKIY